MLERFGLRVTTSTIHNYATKPRPRTLAERQAGALAKLDAEVATRQREGDTAAAKLGWRCQAGCFQRNYGTHCSRCGRLR